VYGWIPAAQNSERAREAVTRAIALDPSLAEVQLAEGTYILHFERQWRRAEAPFRRAIAINPRFAGAHAYLGLLLAVDGRDAEAQVHANLALELDPFSPYIHYIAAFVAWFGRRFEASAQTARRVLELQPDSMPGLWVLGLSLTALGRHDESLAVLERAVAISRAPIFMSMLGIALARAGRTDDVGRLLNELADRASRGEYVVPAARLSMYVGLGDLAGIRHALEACIQDATPYNTVRSVAGPFLDAYRADPDIGRLYDQLRNGRS
jgi:tetratricopeptide (TPR) repeat protein